MEDLILELLRNSDYTPLNAAELMTALNVHPHERRMFDRVLARLERGGKIARIKQGDRYAIPQEADLVPGRIRMNRQGSGLLQPSDPGSPALRIPPDATGTAMHGDRVLVRRDVVPSRSKGVRPGEETGRVIRVLETARQQIVGTLQRGKQFLYVIPDDPRIPHDIFVPEPRDVGRPARVGDKVVVELRDWASRNANPEGEVIEVLGAPDAEGVDMLSVIRQYNLTLHFPKRVLQEARVIGNEVKAEEFHGRVDCRSHLVITIDPEDAKDFDDAICLQSIGNGQWKLWVHIADVSHYVKPGTALDIEAAKRGNSTYLVDRVIPMLPEALSNELCSLKPAVDRLTKCVEFLLSNDGAVLKTQFYPAIIHSKRRFHYKEAFWVLQRAPQDAIERMLHDANAMAQKIRRTRFRLGSLDLDFPETKIILDDEGRILRIDKVVNDISHQLIEEYMLLANEAVASRLMAISRPAVYRIHEPPDEKRLAEYREEVLSHHIQCGNLSNRREVQKLLEKLGQIPIGPALKVGFLKSLMRARYSMEPIGHYGLAKKKYTHFTSPIRRYADLIVHRALFGKPGDKFSAEPLAEVADHISETERNSADAERDSRDIKLFAYLRAQLDSPNPTRYPAMITDVRNFGFFVDVQGLGMSGLVPMSQMGDDFYQFNVNRGELVGRRNRRTFRLGDKVAVQIAKVDMFKRQVDFKLVDERGQSAARSVGVGRTSRPPERPGAPSAFQKRSPFREQRDWRRPGEQKSRRPGAKPGQRSRDQSRHQGGARKTNIIRSSHRR